jgi:hypothetical protein
MSGNDGDDDACYFLATRNEDRTRGLEVVGDGKRCHGMGETTGTDPDRACSVVDGSSGEEAARSQTLPRLIPVGSETSNAPKDTTAGLATT